MVKRLVECANCGKEFWKPQRTISEDRRNFCCVQCFKDFQRNNSKLYKKSSYSKTLRKLLTYAEIREKARR